MSKVIPIAPSTPEGRRQESPIDDVHRHLLQADAIADLLAVMPCDDLESLGKDTVSNAMWCIRDRIEAARAAAEAVHKNARAPEKPQP